MIKNLLYGTTPASWTTSWNTSFNTSVNTSKTTSHVTSSTGYTTSAVTSYSTGWYDTSSWTTSTVTSRSTSWNSSWSLGYVCSAEKSVAMTIIGYYKTYCKRCPDVGALDYWYARYTAGVPLSDIRSTISSECTGYTTAKVASIYCGTGTTFDGLTTCSKTTSGTISYSTSWTTSSSYWTSQTTSYTTSWITSSSYTTSYNTSYITTWNTSINTSNITHL